jgi:hypothetical protein
MRASAVRAVNFHALPNRRFELVILRREGLLHCAAEAQRLRLVLCNQGSGAILSQRI